MVSNRKGEWMLETFAAKNVTNSYAHSTGYYQINEGSAEGFGIAGIIAIVIAFILALVIFFGFVMRKKEPKSKFGRYMKEFLNFRKMWIASILKFFYIFLALAMTLCAIVAPFFAKNEVGLMILISLLVIVFGNILLRLGYEMTMVLVGIWENTADIRKGVLHEEPEKKAKE